jgi:hypothetical protein
MTSRNVEKKKGTLVGRVASIAVQESGRKSMTRRFAVSTLNRAGSGGHFTLFEANCLMDQHLADAKGRPVMAVNVNDREVFANLVGKLCKIGAAMCRFETKLPDGKYLVEVVEDGGVRLGNSIRIIAEGH